MAVGATALGALAIGALAIARLGIGHLSVKYSRFGTLKVDDLTVKRLRAAELIVEPEEG
jgi:hypothetical protein